MPTVPTIVETPFYAYAGAVDLAVEKVREQVATLPATAKVLAAQRPSVEQLRETVKLPSVEQLRETVKDSVKLPTVAQLREQVQFPDVTALRALPTEVQATLTKRYTELSEDLKALPAKATALYTELAGRGEKVVAGLRKDAVVEEKKAETTVKAAAKKAPARAKAATKKAQAEVQKVETELAGADTTIPVQTEDTLG